jgi:DNA (cytosine-5)-methyltransferase 1
MRFASVCSGIEAASVAWYPLGWTPAFYAEIEAFPSAVLSHHYPEVENRGDIRRFAQWPDADIDVLVGGTPCQSFSVAGLRAGLDDPRGNLMLTYLAIAQRYRPAWLVWENVPGVLSIDGGRTFGTLLGGLGQLGYGWAYRSLDAQYFNLAQRRQRVFVVASIGGWRCAAAVLFERASLSGHPAPSRDAREAIAGAINAGAHPGSYNGQDASAGSLLAFGGNNTSGPIDAATACNAKGGSGRIDFESETLITHSLRADGFVASEDGSGRGTPLIAICFDETQITSATNRCNPQAGDPSHPLVAGARPPTIAFSCKDHGADSAHDVAPTLRAMGHDGSHATAGGQLAIAEPFTLASRGRNGLHELEYRQDGVANALLTPSGGRDGMGIGAIASGYAVRRLTPRECERLQGFEDDYSLIPYRGKPAADGPRYKALGNSMAVPVMRWLGQRIERVSRLNLCQ